MPNDWIMTPRNAIEERLHAHGYRVKQTPQNTFVAISPENSLLKISRDGVDDCWTACYQHYSKFTYPREMLLVYVAYTRDNFVTLHEDAAGAIAWIEDWVEKSARHKWIEDIWRGSYGSASFQANCYERKAEEQDGIGKRYPVTLRVAPQIVLLRTEHGIDENGAGDSLADMSF